MSLTVAVRSIVNATLGSGGTSATVSPGELSLVLSQPASTLSVGLTVAVGMLVLTLSQPASTVATGTNVTVSPGELVLTLSQPASTIAAVTNATVTPGDLTLTLSQPAATVSTVRNVTVSASDLVVTFSQPAATVGLGPSVSSIVDNRANYASSQIPVGSALEVNFAATTVATKPKWPYDASAPSGISGTLGANVEIQLSYDNFSSWVSKPAYYEQTFTHLVHSDSPSQIATGQDWLYPTATYQWTAKYQVTAAGSLKYRISFQDAGGTTVTSASTAITTVTSAAKGIIKKAASDSRYFEYADGSFFWPVGANASEIGDNQSNLTDIDMDDGQEGNRTSMAAWASTGGINFMRWFANTLGVQSNAGSPWVDANNRTRLAMLARDGETADSGSGSDAAWRLDNRSYAITTTGTLTSGTFTITIDGQTTAAIPYTAAGDTVFGALKLLSNVGDPNMFVDLAGGPTMATNGTVVRFFPSPDAPLPTTVSISSSVGGGSIALTSTAANIGSAFIRDGWLKRSAAVKPSTVYKFTVRYRIPTTLVAANGSGGGLTVKLDTNWINDPPVFGVSGTGTYITDATSGSGGTNQKALTNTGSGWATLTGYYATTSTQRWLPYVYVVVENCSTSSGGQVVYVDYVKIEETNGSGVVNGPQINNRWDADFHQEFDEFYAKNLDLILTEADTNAIALKLVMDGADALVGSFKTDGSIGVASNTNFYGPSDQTITRGRWWLRAWWRYLHARWGHFSSVHTFELMNEGDPFDGGHANLAQMFGTFLGQKTHQWANSHLTTTSFFHSWPRALFTDAKVADATLGIDYADIHLYVRDPAQFTGTQTYNSSQNYASSPATSINTYIDDTTNNAIATGYVQSDWRDPPLNVDRLGTQIGANASQGLGVPVMRGENGLYDSSTDSPATTLASDTGLIWLRKHLWGQLHPSGLMDPSWWYWRSEIYDRSDGSPNQLAKFKPWSDFVTSLGLNTGGYVDAAATAPHAELRATGLKHTTSGKCYLWIDHLINRWTDVVAGTTITARSGNVTVGSMPNGTYDVAWYDPGTSGSTPSSTTTATASGGTLTLPLPAALSTDIAVKATLQGALTVSPGELTLTLSQPTATVTANRSITASAALLTATFVVPTATVSTGQSVTVSAGIQTATLSIPAVTISAAQNAAIAAPLQVVTFSVPTSTVSTGQSAAFSAGLLVLSLSQPAATVSSGQSLTVSVGIQVVTASIPAATASAGCTVSAGLLTLTTSVNAATVTTVLNRAVSAPELVLSLSMPAATVQGHLTGGGSTRIDRGRFPERSIARMGI